MKPLALRTLAAAAVTSLLCACAISTPFRGMAPATDSAVLVVTHAVLDPRTRADFDAQTRNVVDGLPLQPGLLGYSVRRELLGNQVWTITVWADEAARARFVASALHREAMAEGSAAITSIRVRRFALPEGSLPVRWRQALELLDGPAPARP